MELKKTLIFITYGIFTVLLIIPLVKVYEGALQNGWQECLKVLQTPEVLHALQNSIILVIVVTLFNSIFGVMLAMYLVRSDWIGTTVKKVIDSIVDFPFAVSPVIGGFMIVLLFGPQTVLGTFFGSIGAPIVYAIPGMILATLFITFPFMVREVAPILKELGSDQEQAAYTLGAGDWKTFWSITWPSIRHGVLYGVVLTIARTLGEFGAIIVVSGNIVGKTQTATTYVYQAVEDFQYVSANTIACILVSVSIVILLLLELAKRRKEVV